MEKEMEKGKKRRHFVLVHGACHGAWCWYKLVPLLKSAGHQVTALDMAASGIHPKQVHQLDSIKDYVEPLIQFLGSLELAPDQGQVILVGHSLGGICISVAMEMFPNKIAAAVFVTAFMPAPGQSYVTLMEELQLRRRLDSNFSKLDSKSVFEEGLNNDGNGFQIFGPNFLASRLYQLSPIEDLTLAMSLLRPSPLFGDQELLREETRVTKDNYGAVPKVYIVAKQDQVLKEDFQMWMVEQDPTCIDVKVIAAADHMVMFSEPRELFSCLQEVADTYH